MSVRAGSVGRLVSRRMLALFALAAALPTPVRALQDWGRISVTTTHVRGDVYAVLGTGANQTVSVGDDGVLVVDAGYAQLGDRLLGAIQAVAGGGTDTALSYLVDTHWHFDHVGANAVYIRAGAVAIAHAGTASLMAADQTMPSLDDLAVPATPPHALPGITFTSRLDLRWNGGAVEIVHAPRAHTAGDALVYFRGADVVHVGDLFFNGMYPFIDVDHGGSLAGLVAACEGVLTHSGTSTLYVPGHGAIADRAGFQRYVDMLRTVHERVSDLVGRGLSRDQVIAAKPTADLDAVWSHGGGFNEPDVWVGLVYDGEVPPGA